jgi:hypothetical protein
MIAPLAAVLAALLAADVANAPAPPIPIAAAPSAAGDTPTTTTASPAAATATSTTAALPAPPARLPMRFALQTEAAIGVYPGDFYNHLLGARLDLVFSSHVSFGGYLGYANLKGKEGRASNLLAYAQIEYLAGPANHVRIPFRFASGYMPRNGPVMRLSTGFAFPLTPTIDLFTEVLAPMIWLTSDQMVLSMDLAAELVFRF